MIFCPMHLPTFRSAIRQKIDYFLSKAIKNEFPKLDQLRAFVKYLNENYLSQNARFPADKWSHWNTDNSIMKPIDVNQTNNQSECLNSQLSLLTPKVSVS